MKTKLKIAIRYTAITVCSVIAVVVILFIYVWSTEYRPGQIEELQISGTADSIKSDTIKILSWNIGYAGYEDSMDFFYDGGTRVRTTKKNALSNLNGIMGILSQNRDADFILLQEVDIHSKRSYHMNMLDSIASLLPEFDAYFAPNFKCKFVPIPLTNPVGDVESGLVLLTKYRPITAKRHQLPGSFSFPVSIFNLKRCILETSFHLPDGDTLWLVDIHNSAFDDGSMRRQEIRYIDSITQNRKYSFLCGDWNSNPPCYIPTREETSNAYFSPIQLKDKDFSNIKFAVDTSCHTMRYLYEPYCEGRTLESLLDFGIYTKGLSCISTTTLKNHRFRYSDHNPVLYRILVNHPESESH